MSKELIISSSVMETRLAILENDEVTEFFIERAKNKGILGNIYKGRVTRVLPGMQAAFVDIGLERNAFLYVSDFAESLEEYESLIDEPDGQGKGFDEGAPVSSAGKRKRGGRDGGGPVKKSSNGGSPASGPLRRLNEAGPFKRRGFHNSSVLPDALELQHVKHGRVLEKLTARSGDAPAATGILPLAIAVPEALSLIAGATPDVAPPIFNPIEAEPDPIVIEVTEDADPSSSSDAGNGAPREKQPRAKNARVKAPSEGASLKTRADQGRKRRLPRNNANNLIGDLLKEGQEILVQISKEPIAKKGARITSHVALPGRFMVYMPTVDHVGVSRRIFSDKERARLRNIVLQNRDSNSRGFIVRTAGEGQDEKSVIQDIHYLTRLWDDIRARAEKASAPRLIHSEPGLVERTLRDQLATEFRSIRVDDESEYERIVEFVNRFSPELVRRVRLYDKPTPIFDEFSVTGEIERALKEKVWLKNGGYIVINQTEALVAIDVNTGKFVGSTTSLEETITQANLNAVKEVVRQIRLRDLGGIIIIDFIDMDDRRNRHKVMDALQEQLRLDKSPSKILQFNEFGLVAITRKRVRQSLERTLCQPCSTCGGSGLTRSIRTVCYSIHQEVRKMLQTFGDRQELLLRCHPDVGRALRNGERLVLREIEALTGKTLSVKPDPLMHVERFDLIEH